MNVLHFFRHGDVSKWLTRVVLLLAHLPAKKHEILFQEQLFELGNRSAQWVLSLGHLLFDEQADLVDLVAQHENALARLRRVRLLGLLLLGLINICQVHADPIGEAALGQNISLLMLVLVVALLLELVELPQPDLVSGRLVLPIEFAQHIVHAVLPVL